MTQLPNYVDRMLHVRRSRLNFRRANVVFPEPLHVPRFLVSSRRTRMMSQRKARFTLDMIAIVLLHYHLALLA